MIEDTNGGSHKEKNTGLILSRLGRLERLRHRRRTKVLAQAIDLVFDLLHLRLCLG